MDLQAALQDSVENQPSGEHIEEVRPRPRNMFAAEATAPQRCPKIGWASGGCRSIQGTRLSGPPYEGRNTKFFKPPLLLQAAAFRPILQQRWLSSLWDGQSPLQCPEPACRQGRPCAQLHGGAPHPPAPLVPPLTPLQLRQRLSSALQQGGTAKQQLLQRPGAGYKWELTWRLAQSEQGPAWSLQRLADPPPCPRRGAAAAGAPAGSALRGLRLAQAAGVGRAHCSCVAR